MSKTVWKYDLGTEVVSYHDIPADAKIRHVGLDPKGRLSVWMEVDDEFSERDRHTFGIFTSRQQIPDDWEYVDSLIIGSYMFHIYHFAKLETVTEVES